MVSRKRDANKSHADATLAQRSSRASGSQMPVLNDGNNLLAYNANDSDSRYVITSRDQTSAVGGVGSRPINTAYHPHIHA